MNILAQPVENANGQVTQISFILSYSGQNVLENQTITANIDRARAKYEAISENLRTTFARKNNLEELNQLILMETIETDIFAIELLKNNTMQNERSRIDISQLCKQTVTLEQHFAKLFKCELTFEILNFGWKDITPLTVENYSVKPEQLTGPFFTVECDVQKIGLLVKKLLDISVLLASRKTGTQIHLSVEQGKEDDVLIRIISNCPTILEEELDDLYMPYYGRLATKTNLQVGSGLEGYLIKVISESLGIAIDMKYNDTPSANISFTFLLKKNFSPYAPRKNS